jgi:hypothetical protein
MTSGTSFGGHISLGLSVIAVARFVPWSSYGATPF